MQFKELKNNRFIKDYFSNYKLTIAIVLIIFFWAMMYVGFFHTSYYNSIAKVWVKDIKSDSFVADMRQLSQLDTLSASSNPLLTQIEILKSKELANQVEKNIKHLHPKKINITEQMNINTKVGTDIINIGLKWNTAEGAQLVLNIILKEYEKINIKMNKKLETQRRKYIDVKLKEIEENLIKIRQKIKAYKAENLANNIDLESDSLVSQNINFSTKLENLKADMSKAIASIRELEQKLSLDSDEALNAVALGKDNSQLITLKEDLNTALQQYQFDSTRLADTNPKMVALKNKIDTIKGQIKEQIIISLGEFIKPPKVKIFDPVRQKLVQDLVTAQTNYIGYLAEKQSLEESININKEKQSKIPEKQFILDNLKQEEMALSKAFDELRKKQIEAKIKEAETVSNISIIDSPSLPESPAFPRKFHVLIFSIFLGLGFSVIASIIKTIIEDVCDDIDYIEKVTGTDIIGIVPWLKEMPVDFSDEKDHQIFDIAYKNLISNMMIKCYKNDARIISFTSTSIKKPRESMLYKLTKAFKKFGHKAILLDIDFRIPTMCNTAESKNDINTNFSDLILDIEEKINKKIPVNKEQIIQSVVYNKDKIPFLGNKEPVLEPYEFFGTVGFSTILSALKEEFDWVFIDTPACHIFPEFLILFRQSDGVVIFINRTVTVSDFTQTVQQLKKNNIPIIGTIVRQSNSRLEKEYEKYLQYLMEKMLQDQNLNDIDLDNLSIDDIENLIEKDF